MTFDKIPDYRIREEDVSDAVVKDVMITHKHFSLNYSSIFRRTKV